MKYDFSDYSVNSALREKALLLSERSQQIVLAVLREIDKPHHWTYTDDFDEVEAALAEAYQEVIEDMAVDFTPVGIISFFLGLASKVPEKWLICDGDTYLIDDYPDLHFILRDNFPFDATTFDLPDLTAQFLYGAGNDGQISDTGGSAVHTLTIGELPAHTHTIDKGNADGNTQRAFEASAATPSFPTQNTSSVGSNEAHNNMPPYIRGYWIIKALP